MKTIKERMAEIERLIESSVLDHEDKGIEGSYETGNYLTTHTSAAFKHVCGYYGLTIERNPDGIGSRCYVAKDSTGQVVGNFMDGLGTFYRDKLPVIAREDFMGVAQAPEATVVDESEFQLADRIESFLDSYGKVAADYDPEYCDPDERWNGPDSAMLDMAAKAIRSGRVPPVVHSDIGSGCYRNYFDPAVQAEHQAILDAITRHRKGQGIDEDVVVSTPEKRVRVVPTSSQVAAGVSALSNVMGSSFAKDHGEILCSAIYTAMVGSHYSESMVEGSTSHPVVVDTSKPLGASIQVFGQDDMDPIVIECNLPPGLHELVPSKLSEASTVYEDELTEVVDDTVKAFLKLLTFLTTTRINLGDLKPGKGWSYYMRSPTKLVLKSSDSWIPLATITDAVLAERGVNWTLAQVVEFLESRGIKQVKRPASRRPTYSMYDSEDMGDDDQLSEYGGMSMRRSRGWAILPATMALYGKRVVDIKTAASEWAPHEETILVCTKEEGSRQRILFLASSGSPSSWLKEMGTTHECFHDQTQASKGFYTVVNVVGFKDGEIISSVNDIGLNVKASVSVFK